MSVIVDISGNFDPLYGNILRHHSMGNITTAFSTAPIQRKAAKTVDNVNKPTLFTVCWSKLPST